MNVFLFEWVTGGGNLGDSSASSAPPNHDLFKEGLAMLSAIATDLSKIPNTTVSVLWDRRLGEKSSLKHVNTRFVGSQLELFRRFDQAARSADYTMMIAPEINDQLRFYCQRASEYCEKVVAPKSEFLQIASDKHRTCTELRKHKVPCPDSWTVQSYRSKESPVFPVIRKPRLGAGSYQVQLVDSISELGQNSNCFDCVQSICAGGSASVGFLCQQDIQVALPPMWQHIDSSGGFKYCGGSSIQDANAASRATRLAKTALQAIPGACGYVGVDVVLGNCQNGTEDAVIEINPRFSTSFVGARQMTSQNLILALLQVFDGQQIELSFEAGDVAFGADGSCHAVAPLETSA